MGPRGWEPSRALQLAHCACWRMQWSADARGVTRSEGAAGLWKEEGPESEKMSRRGPGSLGGMSGPGGEVERV